MRTAKWGRDRLDRKRKTKVRNRSAQDFALIFIIDKKILDVFVFFIVSSCTTSVKYFLNDLEIG